MFLKSVLKEIQKAWLLQQSTCLSWSAFETLAHQSCYCLTSKSACRVHCSPRAGWLCGTAGRPSRLCRGGGGGVSGAGPVCAVPGLSIWPLISSGASDKIRWRTDVRWPARRHQPTRSRCCRRTPSLAPLTSTWEATMAAPPAGRPAPAASKTRCWPVSAVSTMSTAESDSLKTSCFGMRQMQILVELGVPSWVVDVRLFWTSAVILIWRRCSDFWGKPWRNGVFWAQC